MGLFIYNKGVLFSPFCLQYVPNLLECLHIPVFCPIWAILTLILARYVYLCLSTMRTGWKWKVSTQEWIHYTYLRLYWHIDGVLPRWIFDFCLCLVKNGQFWPYAAWYIYLCLTIMRWLIGLVSWFPWWSLKNLLSLDTNFVSISYMFRSSLVTKLIAERFELVHIVHNAESY